jgi:hypothetical protein
MPPAMTHAAGKLLPPPPPLKGRLQLRRPNVASMPALQQYQPRFVAIQAGKLYWWASQEEAEAHGYSSNCRGCVDFAANACSLEDSGDQDSAAFVLKPAGGRWAGCKFAGAEDGRELCFDATGCSDAQRNQWIASLRAHILHGEVCRSLEQQRNRRGPSSPGGRQKARALRQSLIASISWTSGLLGEDIDCTADAAKAATADADSIDEELHSTSCAVPIQGRDLEQRPSLRSIFSNMREEVNAAYGDHTSETGTRRRISQLEPAPALVDQSKPTEKADQAHSGVAFTLPVEEPEIHTVGGDELSPWAASTSPGYGDTTTSSAARLSTCGDAATISPTSISESPCRRLAQRIRLTPLDVAAISSESTFGEYVSLARPGRRGASSTPRGGGSSVGSTPRSQRSGGTPRSQRSGIALDRCPAKFFASMLNLNPSPCGTCIGTEDDVKAQRTAPEMSGWMARDSNCTDSPVTVDVVIPDVRPVVLQSSQPEDSPDLDILRPPPRLMAINGSMPDRW